MITITTLLYEGNLSEVINKESWFLNFNPTYAHKKLIIVNNVNNRGHVEYLLEKEIKNKLTNIDYFFVEDIESKCIETYNLEIDKNKTLGYYYIIPYFALIESLDTDFVFHISEDCTKNICFDEKFVESSMESLIKNPHLLSTTLSFGYPKQSYGYDPGEWEQMESFRYKDNKIENSELFWYSLGFSDQIFISRTESLKKINYNLETRDNPICRGTSYCPDSWERRVAEYMYQNNMFRGIWKNNEHYYIHGK